MPREAAPLAAIVLAAGLGKRMASPLAKVLHRIGGRPLVCHVVDAARGAGARPIAVVVGHQAEAVRAAFAGEDEGLRFTLQAEPLGTGHAAASGLSALEGVCGDVLLLCGDVPLLRAETLRGLLRRHRRAGAAAAVLTAVVENPAGYGRVIRDGGAEGPLRAIVEEADATEAQRAIREVNTGTYAFDLEFLSGALPRLRAQNRQGEFYLTDVLALAAAEGRPVLALPAPDPEGAMGVNTPADLVRAEALWAARGGGSPEKADLI